VLAGQSTSNNISVNSPDLTQGLWMPLENFTDEDPRIATRLQSLYVCLFNRHRIFVDPTSDKFSYVANVYQNNIIPLFPWIDKYDPRLTNHDCDLSTPQYTPDTISQVDNLLVTDTSSNWLYFGANLRGGAKENLNLINRIQPTTYYEGTAKVFDGATFVYWNPANGPNSFLG
jgi:hypothetical protein